MPATFRTDDSDSNAYARFPVQSFQKITTFNTANFASPQLVASGETSVLGSRISKLIVTTNDTLDNQIQYYLNDGSLLSTLPFAFDGVPALSGSGIDVAKFAINSLRSSAFEQLVDLDNNGNPFFMLQAGYSIYARLTSSVSAAKTVQVISWVDDY